MFNIYRKMENFSNFKSEFYELYKEAIGGEFDDFSNLPTNTKKAWLNIEYSLILPKCISCDKRIRDGFFITNILYVKNVREQILLGKYLMKNLVICHLKNGLVFLKKTDKYKFIIYV
jgi:hypothetical protein